MPLWPKPLPRWYWRWQAWVDSGRKTPRPADAPRRIPAWAWTRYALHRGTKPKPGYTGLFVGDGVFLRGPGGESEDVAAMDAAGFAWIAANIGDHPADSWTKIRLRATSYGLSFIPWARIMPENGTVPEAIERVRRLVHTAQQWGSRALILNLENEAYQPHGAAAFPPERAAILLTAENWRGETAVSTVGYPPAWPNWASLQAVGLMQAFMNERADLTPAVCVKRGLECGFKAAYPTFGVYPGPIKWTPQTYLSRWQGPYSLYTGDNVGADHAWSQW